MMPTKRTIKIDPLQVIGTDPGSVNFGASLIQLNGFIIDGDKIYPMVSPIEWVLWNIKKTSYIRYVKDSKSKKFTVVNCLPKKKNSNIKTDKLPLHDKKIENEYDDDEEEEEEEKEVGLEHVNMTQLSDSLNTIVAKSKWIFKPYETSLFIEKNILPILATEIQCGHIKSGNNNNNTSKNPSWGSKYNKTSLKSEETQQQQQQGGGGSNGRQKMDIFLLSKLLPSSVNTLDNLNLVNNEDAEENQCAKRIVIHKSLKYGIRNDNSLSYSGRKQESINVTKALLEYLGEYEALQFLNDVKESGQKIDDFCDAFLLAVQAAIDYVQKLKKNLVDYKKLRPLPTNQPSTIKITKECYVCLVSFEKEIPLSSKSTRKEKCATCKTLSPYKVKTKRQSNLSLSRLNKNKNDDDDDKKKKKKNNKKDKKIENKPNKKKKKEQTSSSLSTSKTTKRKRSLSEEKDSKEENVTKKIKQSLPSEKVSHTKNGDQKGTLTLFDTFIKPRSTLSLEDDYDEDKKKTYTKSKTPEKKRITIDLTNIRRPTIRNHLNNDNDDILSSYSVHSNDSDDEEEEEETITSDERSYPLYRKSSSSLPSSRKRSLAFINLTSSEEDLVSSKLDMFTNNNDDDGPLKKKSKISKQ